MSTPAPGNGEVPDVTNGAAELHGMDPAEYAKLQAAEERLATAEEVPPPAKNPIKRYASAPGSGMARTHESAVNSPSANLAIPENSLDYNNFKAFESRVCNLNFD